MSEHYRRGRNWFAAIGVLFMVMAGIVIARQLVIWGPEFVWEFTINGDVTNEKVSAGMLGFGAFLVIWGLGGRGDRRLS